MRFCTSCDGAVRSGSSIAVLSPRWGKSGVHMCVVGKRDDVLFSIVAADE